LIIFAKVNKLELLEKLFGSIYITKEIYRETVDEGRDVNAPDAQIIKNFIDDEKINILSLNEEYEAFSKKLLKIYPQLDMGESEAISLCLQEKKNILVMDEHEGRKVAKFYGIRPIGSLRVLLQANNKNYINENELRKIIEEMIKHKFRLGGEIINEFWNIFEKIKKGKKG